LAVGAAPFRRDPGQRLSSGEGSTDALNDVRRELALWEDAATGEYRSSELSAVDLAVYPFIAPFLRLASRKADFVKDDVFGPRLALWIDRMQTLPIVQSTLPPVRLAGRGALTVEAGELANQIVRERGHRNECSG
jgi:hypothetical protein